MDYNQLVGSETLTGSIKYAINYSRIDSAGIVAEAEAWIYLRLRVSDMKAVSAVPIVLNDTSLAFPTGYLDPIHFGVPGQISTIRLTDPERFNELLGWDGSAVSVLPLSPPTRWAHFDGRIQLNCRSDAAYSARMTHYKTPTALSPANTTNFLTSKYPTLLRRVCLMFAAEARKEWDTVNTSEVKAMEIIDEIKKTDDLTNRGQELDFNWEENS